MQKKQAKYVIALWFVVVLIFSILPGMAFAAEVSEETELSTEEWDVSRSKTATELNELFESQVTLSLPSAEKQLVTDVVLVLDKSTSTDLENQVLNILEDLKSQIEGTGAKINVGVVIFNKVANASEFMDLSTQFDEIETAIKQDFTSGTNTHAGLLAGKSMLDSDMEVESNRKFLIFVSDCITYMYHEAPTATAWSFWADGEKNWAGPDNWNSKYGTNAPPADWDTYLAEVENQIAIQGTTYEYPYGGTIVQSTPVEEQSSYANSVDKALYLTNQVYQEAVSAGYHCYAVTANQTSGIQYAWGSSFMNYLAEGKNISFDEIQNDIVYLVDSGSYVEDYMGYVSGDYNFNFVNDASALYLTVGRKKYEAINIDENTYGFKPLENGEYAYTVTYTQGNLEDTEHFVWNINESVTNFAPVQLTYTVKLDNPKSEAGVYGTYDSNGSKNYAGLYTNNSATLYPVNSFGDKGKPQIFAKPTVSYTVKEEPATPIEPTEPVAPVNPSDDVTPVTTTTEKAIHSPQTGDSSNTVIWITVAVMVSGAIIGTVFFVRKKKAE